MSLRAFAVAASSAALIAQAAHAQCQPAWVPAPSSPIGEIVCSLNWDPDGSGPQASRLLFGGSFGNATTGGTLAYLDAATNTFVPLSGGPQGIILSLAQLPSGDLLVGGNFSTILNGTVSSPANSLARFSPSTGQWTALGTATSGGGVRNGPSNGGVYGIAVNATGSEVVLGGIFSTVDGINASRVARYLPATNTLTSAGTTAGAPLGGVDGTVLAVAYIGAGPQAGRFVIGGTFNTALNATLAAQNIVLFTPGVGATGTISALPGAAIGDQVAALAVLPSGDLLAGSAGLRRYTFAAGSWSLVANLTSGGLAGIRALSTGDALLMGTFSVSGATGTARYRAANNDIVPVVGGVTLAPAGRVWTALVGGDGTQYFGGSFTATIGNGGGAATNFAAAVTAPAAASFSQPPASVVSCMSRAGVLSASVTGGTPPITYQWQWRPVGGTTWQNVVAGPNSLAATPATVSFGAWNPDRPSVSLFTSLATTPPTAASTYEFRVLVNPSGGCAQLASNPVTWTACPADFDCSGARSIDDIFIFLNGWFAGCP